MLLSKSIELHEQIKIYREKLNALEDNKGALNDSEVIEASQELDKLKVSLQKMIISIRLTG
ncbi:aspartyl-phosphate phosphatase Spo0E family protein [Neobacillus vireti]|uniref:aspartyl-phosphate phosphatase Spo0E family protein n=1 Tax=Neobacillus vireti TaxID=220686 RepID=UPI002FFDE242